jgi:hypothetical protein
MDYVKRKDSAIIQPSDFEQYNNMQRYQELLNKISELEARLVALETKSQD